MDKRTKILAGFFGLAICYVLVSGVIYPRWIKKWLTIDDEIVKREEELAELQALDDRVTKAKYSYREYMGRAGDNDIGHVMTDVRDRLNKLIDKHILIDAKVTPSRPLEDRKTGLQSAAVTVSAGGSLPSAIEFLRDVSQLPHLARIGNVVLSPSSSSSRRGMISDMLNIRVPIEVWVLPDHRIVGRLQPEDLVHPEFYVRHQDRDYARIWSGEPFQDYVPLVADLPPSYNVQKGNPTHLEVSASGGRGEYTYTWTPSEGLTDPQKARTGVDTSTPGTKRYTVTVADASGHTAQATATVTVNEPPKPAERPQVARHDPPPPPPPPPGPKPWEDGQYKELRMALLRTSGNERLDEFMLYDNRTKELSYYKVGDEFDGGQLIYVHQTGGVARRSNDYFVYPLGLNVAQSLPLAAAEDYPELQRAAAYHRNALQELSEAASKPAASSAGASGSAVADRPQGETVDGEADSHLLDAPKEELGPPQPPEPAAGGAQGAPPGTQAVPAGQLETGGNTEPKPAGSPKPAGDSKRRPPRKSK